MGEVIFYKKFDDPKKVVDPITSKKHEVKGEYVCNDMRVRKFWFYGVLGVGEMWMRAALLFKEKDENGNEIRWESSSANFSTHENPEEYLISEAEQYLQSIQK